MKPLIKLRRKVISLREFAIGCRNISKVEAYDAILSAIDRQLKSLHDRKHDRRPRR